MKEGGGGMEWKEEGRMEWNGMEWNGRMEWNGNETWNQLSKSTTKQSILLKIYKYKTFPLVIL